MGQGWVAIFFCRGREKRWNDDGVFHDTPLKTKILKSQSYGSFGSDDFPFKKGVIFRFQPLVFGGVHERNDALDVLIINESCT